MQQPPAKGQSTRRRDLKEGEKRGRALGVSESVREQRLGLQLTVILRID